MSSPWIIVPVVILRLITGIGGFALATFAGLSTGIGSGIALFTKFTNKRFLAIALGLSAGIMIYVSFVELMQLSFESLIAIYGPNFGKFKIRKIKNGGK